MYMYLKRYLVLILICTITLFLDRYTKNAVLQLLHQRNIHSFKINSFLNFTEVWNQGVSFGFLSDYNLSPLFFIVITMLIVILILCLMKNVPPILQGMIIGGAFGNIADRFLFGRVFDFIDLHVYGWHYPAFNLADSFIVFSIIIIITKAMFFSHRNHPKNFRHLL